MGQLNALQDAVLALIKRFVERQAIVLDAMRDLRPHIIMPIENRGNSELWAKLRIEYSRKPQLGYWGENEEWEYFLHGSGCRLTHRQTGERIEWDAGDLNTFNLDWFVAYLQRLLTQPSDDEAVRTVRSVLEDMEVTSEQDRIDQHWKWRKQILPILEQLYDQDLLSRNDQLTHYTLLVKLSDGSCSDKNERSPR